METDAVPKTKRFNPRIFLRWGNSTTTEDDLSWVSWVYLIMTISVCQWLRGYVAQVMHNDGIQNTPKNESVINFMFTALAQFVITRAHLELKHNITVPFGTLKSIIPLAVVFLSTNLHHESKWFSGCNCKVLHSVLNELLGSETIWPMGNRWM